MYVSLSMVVLNSREINKENYGFCLNMLEKHNLETMLTQKQAILISKMLSIVYVCQAVVTYAYVFMLTCKFIDYIYCR